MKTYFVSGHLDITEREFIDHYVPHLKVAVENGDDFVVGDAKGADFMAQEWLSFYDRTVTVFHMFDSPRWLLGLFPTVGGFETDKERDEAMTLASNTDIAWIRPGREKSGTAKNLARRAAILV